MEHHGNTWSIMATYGAPWQHMEHHVNTWSTMATHGASWQHMEHHGNTWSTMATHGQHMEHHGNTWSTMATHGAPWQHMEHHSNTGAVRDTLLTYSTQVSAEAILDKEQERLVLAHNWTTTLQSCTHQVQTYRHQGF